MVPHEETQIGWDGQHYEDVATLVGWCADEEHLTEARGATHDALIDLMGDRRRGAVGWKWKTGQEARDLLNEFTTNETSQPLLDHYRHLRGMLREYGGLCRRRLRPWRSDEEQPMNKKADLNQVVRYEGKLMEVIAIADGRTITLRPIANDPCPRCGSNGDVHLLEHGPLFQQHVHPVKTIEGDPPVGAPLPTRPHPLSQ